MQYALINNVRSEPFRGARGICNVCLKEVIAKCGDIKVHHWAHLKTNACDKWWENETTWHRSWKSHYPADWREVIKHDQLTDDKHIADICTPNNLVIEFQHSSISSIERILRENFYKNMVWVVDGLKNKLSRKRFQTWKDYAYLLKPSVYGLVHPRMYVPIQWLESSVPIVFDFGAESDHPGLDEYEHKLYCLFPRIDGDRILAVIDMKAFVKSTKIGEWESRISKITTSIF